MLLMDICQSGALIICQGKAAAPMLLQCSAATQQHRAVLHPEFSPNKKVSRLFHQLPRTNLLANLYIIITSVVCLNAS